MTPRITSETGKYLVIMLRLPKFCYKRLCGPRKDIDEKRSPNIALGVDLVYKLILNYPSI